MRRTVRVVGTLVLTSLAVAYLIWKIDLSKTLDVLADTDVAWFALSVAIMVGPALPDFAKWGEIFGDPVVGHRVVSTGSCITPGSSRSRAPATACASTPSSSPSTSAPRPSSTAPASTAPPRPAAQAQRPNASQHLIIAKTVAWGNLLRHF